MIDLINCFAGIGWFEIALDRLNIPYNIKVYAETDKRKKFLYEFMHGGQTNAGDILDYKAKSFPPHDLLVYSTIFFNIAGIEKENYLRFSGRDDSYFWHMMDIVNLRRPKYIIGDNSYWLSTGATHDLGLYEEYMDSIGYDTYCQRVDAYDYGVAQRKQRTMIVSIRQDLNQDFKFPNPKLKPNVFNILEKEVPQKMFNIGSTYGVQTDYPMLVHRYNNTFKVSRQKIYASSLSANYSRGLDKTANRTYVATPQGTRRLTPLEFGRLFGLTDKEFYDLEKKLREGINYGRDNTDTQMYKIISEGTVVNVLVYIFDELLGHLREDINGVN